MKSGGKQFDNNYFMLMYKGGYERANPRRKFRHYLSRLRKIQHQGTLMEIGCAYGFFLREAQKFYSVTGYDISAHAVEAAKELLHGLNVDVFQGGIFDVTENTRYDTVTCFDVLEHIEELDDAFDKIRRLLNDNGILALSVPVYDTAAGWLVGKLDKDKTHVWRQGRRFWRQKLEQHGFSIRYEEGLWRYKIPGFFYMFFGSPFWKNFSPAVYLIGEKMP